MWPSNTIPSGWALCNGSSYSRSEYAVLFSVLGTTYGADDDSTFKLPDMRGLFVAGRGANGYDEINQKGGANTVVLNLQEIPAHKHIVPWGENPDVYTPDWGFAPNYSSKQGARSNDYDNSFPYTSPVGGMSNGNTKAHENRPPYIVLNYIIKLK